MFFTPPNTIRRCEEQWFPRITDLGTIVSVETILIEVNFDFLSNLSFEKVSLPSDEFCVFKANVVTSYVRMFLRALDVEIVVEFEGVIPM